MTMTINIDSSTPSPQPLTVKNPRTIVAIIPIVITASVDVIQFPVEYVRTTHARNSEINMFSMPESLSSDETTQPGLFGT